MRMDSAEKLRAEVADTLITKYGEAAPRIALQRARDCREQNDFATALVWLDVVLATGWRVAKDPVRPRRGEGAVLRDDT
jgi:hypothetical protein